MHAIRFASLLATLLLPAGAVAADHVVTITGNSFSPAELTVSVGDTVTFRNQSGGVHNAQTDPGSPNPFRCANGCDATGGSGQPSAANWTATVTMNNPGATPYYCFVHGGPGGAGMSGTILVAGAPAVPPAPLADLVRLRVGDGPVDIDVLANDRELQVDAGGSLAVAAAAVQGSAVGDDRGTPAAADDRIRYTLPAGVSVDTSFTYTVCNAGGGGCGQAAVRVLARGLRDDDLMLDSAGDAGFVDIALGGLPAMPEARFESTALERPHATGFNVPPDLASPENPWDGASNVQFATRSIPPQAGATEFVLVADASNSSGDVALFIGRDLDGDSAPDADEILCTSSMSPDLERCEARVTHPGPGTVTWWAALHNPSGTFASAGVVMADLVPVSAASELAITGPGHLAAGEASVARVGWHVVGMEEEDRRMGLVRVRPTPASDLGWTPVRIDRVAGDFAGIALVSGRDQPVTLMGSSAHDRMYIDVPPGATSLTASATGGDNFRVELSHLASPVAPGIASAPRDEVVADGSTVTIVPPTLVPGRWYVTPVSDGAFASTTTVRATVTATAPVVRPGSYFNPGRSGHGLFVYPAGTAGSVWTVLWYHYLEDGSPTWYYLEGPAPGANGIFSSPVYRSAWDGDSNSVTPVGEAVLTPSGPDAFTWSWTVDGRSGSEPLASLGRGCPTVDGVQRDASSTWFDPQTAGTGYSVQLFPNGYEYNAAFVYDGQGRPRYLAAELPPPADGAVRTYALEQLTGFCPLCPRAGAPARADIGTFTRTFAAGTLDRIEVDGVYAGGISGAWTGDDTIEPLGGPDSRQGCDP